VYDAFENTAALRNINDAMILNYSNESAEILMLYSK
jgi:hypothetical protein